MDPRHAALSLGRPSGVAALLLLLSLLRSHPISLVQAAGPYLGAAYVNCLRNTSSLSAPFSRNLNTALDNLTNLSSRGDLYATTTGGSSADKENTVYAVFQCRGDQSKQLCSECMQNATARLPQRDCPASVGARIQLDGCFLRYDNQSFFVLDMAYVIGYCYAKTSDRVALTAIEELMQNVTSEAPKRGGFYSASANGEYAAAQCLGYLNESECSQCLTHTSYRTVCDSTLGEQLHLASCYYRYEPYLFFESSPSSPAPAEAPPGSPPASPPPVGSAPPPQKSQGWKTPTIIVGVIVGVCIGGVTILMWYYRRQKIKGEKLGDESASWSNLLLNKAKVFSLKELQQATGNFHPSSRLGEGGFGTVYKGTLSDGEQVAIKRLTIKSQQGEQEFLNEVNLITSVQHKNLIRLLGCCVEDSQRILVYEYLPNRSLDFFLFGETRENVTLDWSTRYGIILGMAKGLAYLHEESHIRIIHRDIKPSNILLNDQLSPVIADFGLARLVKADVTHVNTRVAGTIGYLAPEYAIHGDLSENVDVFSFGLVCLEIITGKPNINGMLLTLVWEKYQKGEPIGLVDEKLGNAFSPEQVIRVVHIALLCTQENPKQRPAMSRVNLWLSGTSDILEVPTRPAFLDYNESAASRGEIREQLTSSSTSSQSTHVYSGKFSVVSGGVLSFTEIMDPR